MTMRTKRAWHKKFIDYTKFIVHHPNYASMPNKFKTNGEIKWVSPSDFERALWWDKQVKKLKLNSRAEVAREIHPKELKGYKPCQICGRDMNIFYVYPNKNALKKINTVFPEGKYEIYKQEIAEIFDDMQAKDRDNVYSYFENIFKIPISIQKNKIAYLTYILKNCTSNLSPGVMSNAPDRLDGFHTYNICCRSKEDTGRHTTNLARYTQDRRAYENWADGNWNYANRLMGEFNKYSKLAICSDCQKLKNMTADHIGPISLGFTHRPKFQALCRECNSKKNNRMTYDNIKTLKKDENKGEIIVSWHSRYLWDLLKNKIKDEKDALKLSKLMRENLHYILIIFSIISEKGYNDYLLRFLHPEYSFIDYKFINFNPITGPEKVLEKPLDSKNKRKNKERYLRISFEALDDYKKVENRNSKVWESKKADKILNQVLKALKDKKYLIADLAIRKVFKQLAAEIAKKY